MKAITNLKILGKENKNLEQINNNEKINIIGIVNNYQEEQGLVLYLDKDCVEILIRESKERIRSDLYILTQNGIKLGSNLPPYVLGSPEFDYYNKLLNRAQL